MASITENMKPISSQFGILQKAGIAAARGLNYLNSKVLGVDADSWMGPGQPIAANPGKGEAGRIFDYPNNWNLNYTPRATEGTSFADLQNLADSYDLLRIIIETRKDQIAKLPWKIQHREKGKEKTDSRIADLQAFFRYPDRNPEHDYHTWLKMLLEDMLVIDAASLFVHPTIGGSPWALRPLDGSTIHPLLDDAGGRPMPPSPGYQQIIKGVPKWYYRTDQLIYRPRNVRTHKVYGFSPVEQIVVMVNLGLRREIFQLEYYTEGNTPEGFVIMPPAMRANDVEEFERRFNAHLSGQTAQRRKLKFLPGDGDKGKAGIVFPKEVLLKDEMDEWLARIVCFAFSISPTPFTKQTNRATAQSVQEAALQEGLYPMMNWVKSFMDYAINFTFGMPDLEFVWIDTKKVDPLVQAQADKINISMGKVSVDECRERDGMDPIGLGHFIVVPTGVLFVDGPYRNEGGILVPANPPLGLPEDVPEPPKIVAPTGKPGDGEQPNPEKDKTVKEVVKGAAKMDKLVKLEKKKTREVKRPAFDGQKEEGELKKILADFFKAQGKKMARQAVKRMSKLSKAADDKDGLDFSGWKIVVAPTQKRLKTVAERSAQRAIDGLGITTTSAMFDQASAEAAAYAEDRAAEMVGMKWVDGELVDNPEAEWAITDTTRDAIAEKVSQAIDEGWSTDDLATAIEEATDFSDTRAATVAHQELAEAYGQGTKAGWRASGVVTMKKSLLSNDHDKDDECDDNADQGAIPINENYSSGDDSPPFHVRCDCDEVAVIDSQAEDEAADAAAEGEPTDEEVE